MSDKVPVRVVHAHGDSGLTACGKCRKDVTAHTNDERFITCKRCLANLRIAAQWKRVSDSRCIN